VNAAELGRQAYAAMAASYAPLPRGLVASFRLWHFPGEGPDSSWVVFHAAQDDPHGGSPLARRVVWDRAGDLRRLEESLRRKPSRRPTLKTTEAGLDPAILGNFMKEAGRLQLPRRRLVRPYVSDFRTEFGLEGFDLEGRDGRPVVRMEWEEPAPLALEAVAHWSDRVRAWLVSVPGFRES